MEENFFFTTEEHFDADTGERFQGLKLRRGRRYEIVVNADRSFDVRDLGPVVNPGEAHDGN